MRRSLVRDGASDGFPTDYVIARIKGRSTTLVTDWRSLIGRGAPSVATDERIWEALLRELEWLHAQLNRGLRETLAPLFGLLEIKTIVLALRNRAIGRTGEIARLLERSLLADDIKEVLATRDVRAAVSALFAELESTCDEGNLRAFENGLMRVYLQETAAGKLEAALKTFFTLFIDLRNAMLLYKQLRWTIGGRCLFIAGGSADTALWNDLLARRDAAGFDSLLRRITGLSTISAAASEGALETILLRSITKRLMESRRTADDVALIVLYVWRLYVQARNLAVLHHGAALDPRTLERELIL